MAKDIEHMSEERPNYHVEHQFIEALKTIPTEPDKLSNRDLHKVAEALAAVHFDLEDHLDRYAAELERRGMSPPEVDED